jgi:hypothetical protein
LYRSCFGFAGLLKGAGDNPGAPRLMRESSIGNGYRDQHGRRRADSHRRYFCGIDMALTVVARYYGEAVSSHSQDME